MLICAKHHEQVIGIALGKKSEDDIKIRCVRVDEPHQQKGVGLHLIDHMLKALDCDKPHCTVSEEMLHQYSRAFINRYQFCLDAVEKGMY